MFNTVIERLTRFSLSKAERAQLRRMELATRCAKDVAKRAHLEAKGKAIGEEIVIVIPESKDPDFYIATAIVLHFDSHPGVAFREARNNRITFIKTDTPQENV